MQIREGDNGVYVSGVEEVLQPDYDIFIAALICNFNESGVLEFILCQEALLT